MNEQTTNRLVRRDGIFLFFFLALALIWLFYLPVIFNGYGFIRLTELRKLGLEFLGVLSPTIAAIVASARSAGRYGLREVWNRITVWRVNPVLFIVALLAPLSLMLLAVYLSMLLSNHVPDNWLMPAATLLTIFPAPVSEEIGWRGFALPQLQLKFKPLAAALIVGVIWAIWHVPMFLVAGTSESTLPFMLFGLEILGESLFVTWLVNKAKGSVLLAILFHAAGNLAFNITPLYPQHSGSLLPLTLLALFYGGIGSIFLYRESAVRSISIASKSRLG